MKNRKFSLVACGASIVLCAGALVGTSLAWFTDVAGTTNNVIASGTLDIDLEKYDQTTGQYVTVDGEENSLFEQKDWMPNDYQIAFLRVTNNGSLPVNYTVDVTVKNADGTTDKGLADALEYGIVMNTGSKEKSYDSWDKFADEAMGGVQPVPYGLTTTEGTALDEDIDGQRLLSLEGNDGTGNTQSWDTFALGIHMRPEVDNSFQNQSISIDVTIRAKQRGSLSDDAVYPAVSAEAAEEAIADAQPGEPVTVALKKEMKLETGFGTELLNGKDITIIGNGATIEASKAFEYVTTSTGKLTIEGVNFVHDGGSANDNLISIAVNSDVDLTLRNCTFSGDSYNNAIWLAPQSGSVTIEDCTFNRPIGLHGDDREDGIVSDVTIRNCKFDIADKSGYDVTPVVIAGYVNGGSVISGNTYNTSSFVTYYGFEEEGEFDLTLSDNNCTGDAGEFVTYKDDICKNKNPIDIWEAAVKAGQIVID